MQQEKMFIFLFIYLFSGVPIFLKIWPNLN